MRVAFFGYSQTGAAALEVLRAEGHEVAAVVTHRDDPAEERWYRTPAEAAATMGMPVRHDDEFAGPRALGRFVRGLAPDLILSVFYREMLPARVLSLAKIAALNLHPSLLPAYRGRAPINWVLVNGERRTGVTLHHMVAAADAGDIVAQRAIEIAPRETALTLYLKVEAEARRLLEEALPLVAAGRAPRTPQDPARASIFGRRRPADGRIDWRWEVRRVDALVRAVAPPWPGAFAEVEGRRLDIHEGEPDPAPGPPAEPGTVRRLGGKLYVAAADGWFRIDKMLIAKEEIS